MPHFFVAHRYSVGTGLQPGNISDLWAGLGYLLIAVIAVNLPTFKQMSRSVESRAKHEAAFKFVHSRIRLHAETIALYSAEDVEMSEVTSSFDSVVSSCRRLIAWQSLFQGLQIAFQFVPSVVAGAEHARLYFSNIHAPFACSVAVQGSHFLTRFRFSLCNTNGAICDCSLLQHHRVFFLRQRIERGFGLRKSNCEISQQSCSDCRQYWRRRSSYLEAQEQS